MEEGKGRPTRNSLKTAIHLRLFFLCYKLLCFPLCRKQHVGNSGASNTSYWKPGCFCNEERNVLEYEVIKQLDKFRCAKSPSVNICLACFYVPIARAGYPLLGKMWSLSSGAIFSLYLFGGGCYNKLIRPHLPLIRLKTVLGIGAFKTLLWLKILQHAVMWKPHIWFPLNIGAIGPRIIGTHLGCISDLLSDVGANRFSALFTIYLLSSWTKLFWGKIGCYWVFLALVLGCWGGEAWLGAVRKQLYSSIIPLTSLRLLTCFKLSASLNIFRNWSWVSLGWIC